MESTTIIGMRPHAASPELQALAEALSPIVRKMLRDPNVVFTRPAYLSHVELPTSVPKGRRKAVKVTCK